MWVSITSYFPRRATSPISHQSLLVKRILPRPRLVIQGYEVSLYGPKAYACFSPTMFYPMRRMLTIKAWTGNADSSKGLAIVTIHLGGSSVYAFLMVYRSQLYYSSVIIRL